MSISRILYLDTTTSQLHLALSEAGAMVAAYSQPCESHRYHSALIVPAIQDLLQQTGITPQMLDALAVNQGPGSFTGIRTGVITARTMAQFLNVPVYLFNTFELLGVERDTPTAIYLDALRNRSYQATLHFDETGVIYSQQPRLLILDPTEASMPIEPLFVSESLAPLFVHAGSETIPPAWNSPAAMLKLILRYENRFLTDWEAVKPLYIQEPSITLKKAPSTTL